MDVQRYGVARKKLIRRIIFGVFALIAVVGITYALSRLEPAAPSVERDRVVVDAVKRGQMLRNVRGLGTLVPEEIMFIPARDEGRVERRLVLPGTSVEPDTVLIELSNPRLEQEVFDAESQLRGAEAEMSNLSVQLQSQTLDQRSAAALVEAEYQTAKAEFDANSSTS
jgi:HlyD family secretion protein